MPLNFDTTIDFPAYPWEEDFTGEWTKKVPFVIAQYQLSQVGTGRKVRIKMPKISGVKSYKVIAPI